MPDVHAPHVGDENNDHHAAVFCDLDQLHAVRRVVQREVPQVEKDQGRGGGGARFCVGQEGQGLVFVARVVDGGAPGLQRFADEPAAAVVVADQQRLHPCQFATGGQRGGVRVLRHGEAGGEVEGAAFPHGAFDPNLPLHILDELFGNGQAQSGAAVEPCGRAFGLGESVEDTGEFFSRDADARVRHGEAQGARLAGLGVVRDADGDFPAVGKFNGVADEVHDDLPQTLGVPDQFDRHIRRGGDEEFEPFFLRPERHKFRGLVQHFMEVEADLLEVDVSRFDFGEVENVVDQIEEVGARPPQDTEMLLLLGQQGAFREEVRHADDGVHRGSDFVAHGGEEFAFGPAGRFRLFFCAMEVGLRVLSLQLVPDPLGGEFQERFFIAGEGPFPRCFAGKTQRAIDRVVHVNGDAREGLRGRHHLVGRQAPFGLVRGREGDGFP